MDESPRIETPRRSETRSGQVAEDIAAYLAGDDTAGDRICRALEPAIGSEVGRFLTADDAERDDIIQETLVALLGFLRRAGRSPDRPEAFVVTMAGNRCRNLYRQRKRRPGLEVEETAEWLAATDADPLELLEDLELEESLQAGFAQLDPRCRQLLLSIYVEQRPMEELQREAGLGTVQGIYYRKYACLKKLRGFLNLGGFGGREDEPE